MLTLSAKFLERARQTDWMPAIICTIDKGTASWKCQSRPCDQVSYPIGICGADPIEAKLDVLKRSTSVGSTVLQFHDEWIRPIIKNYRIRKCRVTLLIGDKRDAEADFVSFASGSIERITPTADRVVEIEIADTVFAALDKSISGIWLGQHPHSIMWDVIVNKCGVSSSEVDGVSFTYSTNTDISDFVTTLGSPGDAGLATMPAVSNEPAKGIIDDLCVITNSYLCVNESGQLAIKKTNIGLPIVATWGRDVHDGKIEVVEHAAYLKNRVTIDFTRANVTATDGSEDKWICTYTVSDFDSMGVHGYPGRPTVLEEHLISTKWINAYMGHAHDQYNDEADVAIDGSTTAIVIEGTGVAFVSGAYLSRPSAGQPIEARINSSRPGYVRVDNEIIRYESVEFDDLSYSLIPVIDPMTGLNSTVGPVPCRCKLMGLTRGALGTSATWHGRSAPVFSYTIPVRICPEYLTRFANGIDIIRIKTGFDQFGVQLGDLVGIVEPSYVSFGIDGLTAATKWEVVGKSARLSEGSIVWELAAAVTQSTTLSHLPARFTPGFVGFSSKIKELADQSGDVNHIRDGLDVSPGTGLAAIVGAGSAGGGSASSSLPADVSVPLSAGRDSHIHQDLITGATTVTETQPGENPPPPRVSAVRLGLVTTNDTQATAADTTDTNTKANAPTNTALRIGAGFVVNRNFGLRSRQ